MDEFFEILRLEFGKLVGQKTGWGKNEIMMCFDKAFTIAVVKYASKKGINLA